MTRVLRYSLYTAILALALFFASSGTAFASIMQEVIVLQKNTYLYQRPAQNTTKLETIPIGTRLQVSDYSTNYYRTIREIGGKLTEGFIQKKTSELTRVQNSADELSEVIVLQRNTYLYQRASQSSTRLETVAIGTRLHLSDYSASYYRAIRVIGGKQVVGYIQKKTTEPLMLEPFAKFIATDADVAGYSGPNTGLKQIKTIASGRIFNAQRISASWYSSFSVINGVRTEFFMHGSSISPLEAPKSSPGIALGSSLPLRKSPSLTSTVALSLPAGETYDFSTFSAYWSSLSYEGETYYVPTTEIDPLVNGSRLRVVAKNDSLLAYDKPTKDSRYSKVLNTYGVGYSPVLFPYSQNWWTMETTLAGKSTQVFFHIDDIILGQANPKPVRAFVVANPANAYSRVTKTGSSVVATFSKGSVIFVEPFVPGWTSAAITDSKGANRRVFFADDEVQASSSTRRIIVNTTSYSINLDTATALQMAKGAPLTDTSGVWRAASSAQVKNYLNPANYGLASSSSFQFLKLSKPANLSATQVNTFLAGKGILANRGASYIKAAQTHQINELYLVSHSLLETGNGTSVLAKGTYYSPKKDCAYKTRVDATAAGATDAVLVYNMYGYGAYDGNAFQGGSKTAYINGWTTPELAIIGGAEKVRYNYINARATTLSGQDTLYKMRWHPEWMGLKGGVNHQYATDIAWAVKQTSRLRNMYATLDSYTLEFDVPSYLK